MMSAVRATSIAAVRPTLRRAAASARMGAHASTRALASSAGDSTEVAMFALG
jgi:hypothetical protein